MICENIAGVPDFECNEWQEKTKEYCVLIPIINEGERIKRNYSVQNVIRYRILPILLSVMAVQRMAARMKRYCVS